MGVVQRLLKGMLGVWTKAQLEAFWCLRGTAAVIKVASMMRTVSPRSAKLRGVAINQNIICFQVYHQSLWRKDPLRSRNLSLAENETSLGL